MRIKLFFVFFLLLGTSVYALMEEKEPIKVLRINNVDINHIVFSIDSSYFAASSVDGKLVLWDTEKIKSIKTVSAYRGKIDFVSFSPDNRNLITIGADSIVKLWSLPQLKLFQQFTLDFKPSLLSFSPDKTSFIIGTSTGNIIFYSLFSSNKTKVLPGYGIPVTCVAFSKSSQRCISGYKDGKMIVWSQFDRTLCSVDAHKNGILMLNYVQKDRYILTAGEEGAVKFWTSDLFKSTGPVCELPGDGQFYSISPNEKYMSISCKNNTVKFMLIPSGVYAETFSPSVAKITSFAVSPDDKLLLVGSQAGELYVYRNPSLVAKYNSAIEKGDEAMKYGKYEMAMVKYAEAFGLFSEKEAETKLKDAKSKKDERQTAQYKKIKEMRNIYQKK